MNYAFETSDVGGFRVYKSAQQAGDLHLKRFTQPGVTPQTQGTLNIYAEGVFSFAIPTTEFVQTLSAGSTSLDLTVAQYPVNAVCEEQVVSPTALRYCVSPAVPLAWTPSVVALAAGDELVTQPDDCIYLMQGSVTVGGSVISKRAFFSHVGVAVCLEDCKLVLARMRRNITRS